jgi:hypothetical protein
VCTHPYQAAASIQAVRDGYGDDYFYDAGTQLLHIRVRELDATFGNWPYFSDVGHPWPRWNSSTVWNKKYFSRGGVELPVTGGSQISIVISYANTCWNTNTCDIMPPVPVCLFSFLFYDSLEGPNANYSACDPCAYWLSNHCCPN